MRLANIVYSAHPSLKGLCNSELNAEYLVSSTSNREYSRWSPSKFYYASGVTKKPCHSYFGTLKYASVKTSTSSGDAYWTRCVRNFKVTTQDQY